MAKSRGKIQKAVIRRLAADLRIPLAAAAHKYDCMSIRRKQDLCKREEARAAAHPTPERAAIIAKEKGDVQK